MNTKVCGITQIRQLHQLEGLDIDFAGLNFYEKSPRYMLDKIPGKDLQGTDFDMKKVGIFVNQDYEDIMKIIEDYHLDTVQLHGDETPELCEQLSEDTEVIKVFRIPSKSKVDIDKLVHPYDAVCDYYLFDASSKDESFGGTGLHFDWDILAKSKIEKPFFLSGGIGREDVEKIKKFKHPDFYGVDLNSKFEKSPGVKDMSLILDFVQKMR